MNEKARRTADENKAVVTGFKEDSDETEVRILLEKSTDVSGMKKAEIVITCRAKPITHAFQEFKDNDQRDKYGRSANMQKLELNGRKMKLSLAMDTTERFHRKRMVFIRLTIVLRSVQRSS